MKRAGLGLVAAAGTGVLLAIGFQAGVAAYFHWADYRARRHDAHERD